MGLQTSEITKKITEMERKSVFDLTSVLPLTLAAIFVRKISEDKKMGLVDLWTMVKESKKKFNSIADALIQIEKSDDRFFGVSSLIQRDALRILKDNEAFDVILGFADKIDVDDEFELRACVKTFVESYIAISGKFGASQTPLVIRELLMRMAKGRSIRTVFSPSIGLTSFSEFSPEETEVFGQEIMVTDSALSIIIHFLLGFRKLKIECSDCFVEPMKDSKGNLAKFDLVYANPPFNQRFAPGYFESIDKSLKENLLLRAGTVDSNWLYVQRVAASLKPKGLGVVLVPIGALFLRNSEWIRDKMAIECKIRAVIHLPSQLLPNTAIPCALIVLSNESENRNILMVKADHFGTLKGRLRTLSEDEISQIASVVKNREEIAGFSRLVGFDELRDSEANLNPQRYILTRSFNEVPDIETLMQNFKDAQQKADVALSRFNKVFNELKS